MSEITSENVELRALQELRRHALSWRALLALEEKLEAAGSVEKVIREKKTRLAQVEQQLAAATSGIAQAEQRAADIVVAGEEKAKQQAKSIEQDALGILAKATAQFEAAEKQAKALEHDARAGADALTAKAETRADEVDRKRAAVQREVDELTQRASTLKAEAASAEARRDAANVEVERLRKVLGS